MREMNTEFVCTGPSYVTAHAEQHASDSENSENLYALPAAEDEDEIDSKEEKVHFKVLSDVELKSLVWRVGMQFASPQIFKGQVIRYAVVAGYSNCARHIYANWHKNCVFGRQLEHIL